MRTFFALTFCLLLVSASGMRQRTRSNSTKLRKRQHTPPHRLVRSRNSKILEKLEHHELLKRYSEHQETEEHRKKRKMFKKCKPDKEIYAEIFRRKARKRGEIHTSENEIRLLEAPNLCGEHRATVCDDPKTILAYAAAIVTGEISPITLHLYFPRVRNVDQDDSQAVPSEEDIIDAVSWLDFNYADAKINFTIESDVWSIDDAPNKKQLGTSLLSACVAEWVNDGQCDESCNVGFLDFDGGDCDQLEILCDIPYQACEIPSRNRCPAQYVGDGFCDGECNNIFRDWDGGDCCPETNRNWDRNHGSGLEVQCDRSLYSTLGNHYDCTGCADPFSPNKQWYGSYGDQTGLSHYAEFKDMFKDCKLDNGKKCYKGALMVYAHNFPGDDLTLGVSTFPWYDESHTVLGGLALNGPETLGVLTDDYGSTITHELGHNFGLYHTFRGIDEAYDQKSGDWCKNCVEWNLDRGELGSMTTGDLCADTRPTPTNYECDDPPNDEGMCRLNSKKPWVDTPFTNFMGYGDSACITEWSPQQLARVRCYMDLSYADAWNAESVPPTRIHMPPGHEEDGDHIRVEWERPIGSDKLVDDFTYVLDRDPPFDGGTKTRTQRNYKDPSGKTSYNYRVKAKHKVDGKWVKSEYWSPWSLKTGCKSSKGMCGGVCFPVDTHECGGSSCKCVKSDSSQATYFVGLLLLGLLINV